VDVLASHADLGQVRLAISQAIARGLTTANELRAVANKRSQRILNQLESLIKRKV
jgi:hypothetical protein